MTVNCHVVVTDLFLPHEVAGEAGAGLNLPALEWLLARAQATVLPTDTLEDWLCDTFGVSNQAIAPLSLLADGMHPGESYWLRADPVHIQMQRDKMILHADVVLTLEEAEQLCASLNTHFSPEALHFFAPHPQRWYLQLDSVPDMQTHPLSQVAGRNVRSRLPQGSAALRWHRIFNEIQMFFFEHPVNIAREARGQPPVNSLWFWGGGKATKELLRPFSRMISDSTLVVAFAQAAGVPHQDIPHDGKLDIMDHGGVLIVWNGLRDSLLRGNLDAWRDSVQQLEQGCSVLKNAFRAGHISRLTLDVLAVADARRFILTRGDSWKLWRSPKPLAHYSSALE